MVSPTCDKSPTCASTDLHYVNCRKMRAEVERQQVAEECAAYGHDWNVVRTADDVPRSLYCDRCGKRYKVVP